MKLYKPTLAEKKKLDKILKDLTPKDAAYRKYRVLTDQFLEQYKALPSKKSFPVKSFGTVKSKLFKYEFLIGYASKNWFNEVAPGCNAIATTSLNIGDLTSPPIVIVPAQERTNQTKEHLSILEHEFVHICQAINGTFPSQFKKGSKDLIGKFLANSQAEYQANYLQLATWPYFFPLDVGLSLNEWCALRGITQTLEMLLQAGITGNLSEKKLFSSLRELSNISPSILKKADLHEPRVIALLKHPKVLVKKALFILSSQSPDLTLYEMYSKLIAWSHGIFEYQDEGS